MSKDFPLAMSGTDSRYAISSFLDHSRVTLAAGVVGGQLASPTCVSLSCLAGKAVKHDSVRPYTNFEEGSAPLLDAGAPEELHRACFPAIHGA